jgi:hypothetical protein
VSGALGNYLLENATLDHDLTLTPFSNASGYAMAIEPLSLSVSKWQIKDHSLCIKE